MAAITKKHATQQLKRFTAQKKALEKIKTTVDQHKRLTTFYDKEIAFWKGWVNRFKEVDQERANDLTVTFETV